MTAATPDLVESQCQDQLDEVNEVNVGDLTAKYAIKDLRRPHGREGNQPLCQVDRPRGIGGKPPCRRGRSRPDDAKRDVTTRN
jgi:hypothetical protein